MPRLIYPMNVSVDGYIEDVHGRFDWFPIDDEVFRFHTELMRSSGTLLYGRRLYESMSVWETDESLAAMSESFAEFSDAWKAASKLVFSRSMSSPVTAETRVQTEFIPDEVARIKSSTDKNVLVGGAQIAAEAFKHGLIDEIQLYVLPVMVGGGKKALPTQTQATLELVEQRALGNVVLLRYAVKSSELPSHPH